MPKRRLKDGADPFDEESDDEDEDPLADALQTLADRDFPDLLDENDREPARKVRQHVRALGWPAAQLREAVLGILEERVSELRRRLKDHEQRAQLALRARAVPGDGSGAPLDRLLRYETAIERSFYRALHELHRLQAARAGNAVPPPVALDVTGTES